jgi:hypothetical protein
MIPVTSNATPASVSKRLTQLGPFFAAEAHDLNTAPTPPWQPMSELLDDPAAAAARVGTSRAFLATAGGLQTDQIELRVAASVTHLGLAARTLSPLLAAAVTSGRTQPTGLRDLHWQPTVGSIFPLSIAGLEDVRSEPPDLETAASAIAGSLAENAIETITAELYAVFAPFGLSERLLRGNIASALNGAGTSLCSASPGHAPRARAFVAALLQQPTLAGTSQTSLDHRFQRRSCCLIYRAAPDRDGPVCGDCILLGTRRTPRAHATTATATQTRR